MDPVSVHIVIPTLDGKLEEACLTGLLETWSAIPCELSLTKGCYIGRNRDLGTMSFLAGNCSHVLYLDADIAWSVEDLVKLLGLDQDFTFGRYPYKGSNPAREVARGGCLIRSVGWNVEPEEGVYDYQRAGAGFMLLKRAAVRKLCEAHPELRYIDPLGRPLPGMWWSTGYVPGTERVEGEDYALCRRWRALGGNIYTRGDVQLGHVGSAITTF